jgi:molybdopterin biosynthesis enzyme
VGEKDNLQSYIENWDRFCAWYCHQTGKPSIIGQIEASLSWSAWHPVAAFFMFQHWLNPALLCFLIVKMSKYVEARLTRAVSSNHGREEVILVRLEGVRQPRFLQNLVDLHRFQGKRLLPGSKRAGGIGFW